MNYKTNTPNYGKSVNNFSDFIDNINSEKEELKSVKRSFKPNHYDTQSYPKNTKLKFNKVTRKMDDLSLDEIDDKIDSIEESTMSNTIDSMSRFLEDYAAKHNAFEKRGMDEGVEIVRKSKDLDEAMSEINSKIKDWELKEKADLMPEDQRQDIIKGLKDLLRTLESKSINESNQDYDVFLKIVDKPSYKELREELENSVNKFTNTLEDCDWFDEGDSDHIISLNNAIQEALNEYLF